MSTPSWPPCDYDLVVIGGTPGGVACAVRAAREGLSVLLVNSHAHLGGMLTSGLAVWDTLWEGRRSPVYDEARAGVFEYYRTTYGEDSPQYCDCLPSPTGHLVGRFESCVVERVITDLVERERNITVWRGFVPVLVARAAATLQSVTLRPVAGGGERVVRATTFADCTYEGDLAALAGVPYRVGREAREEFGEPHAGILFMRPLAQAPDAAAAAVGARHATLKLRHFSTWQAPLPQSSGAADGAVQACNYRTTLTTDPANRVPIPKPAHYDPYYLRSLEVFAGIERVPNGKFSWNRPQLVGRQTAYVEADAPARQRILDEHWDVTLGLMYFLQNDPTVPGNVRKAWQEFGLPRDEYADNGHRPYEMYVREARRITGRAVFTQHEAMLAPGRHRAPVQADSVAMTEWYLDSHGCTTARHPGGLEEGKMMLHQETFPGQVSYRCLLPQELDNLLVPVCLSATHVGWNVIRLEPVFMQTGEAAGLAAALARREGVAVAALEADRLVRGLCARRFVVTFCNDLDEGAGALETAAAQYFGTKGFLADYDVRAGEPLTVAVAAVWAEAFHALRRGALDADATQAAVLAAAAGEAMPVTAAAFAARLGDGFAVSAQLSVTGALSRGAALRWLWAALA